jgi:hypothetical protein
MATSPPPLFGNLTRSLARSAYLSISPSRAVRGGFDTMILYLQWEVDALEVRDDGGDGGGQAGREVDQFVDRPAIDDKNVSHSPS